MGRSVFVQEDIEERILKLFGETKWAYGVLIGQVKLIIYLLCFYFTVVIAEKLSQLS